ncbi:hypothetical protein A3844_23485 [Paenibacillus helianthi]|uniref:Uncharacterized protein n=1 Tax=Paenibacillus helianthi TaxID=1349432 RepID=A0ABX3ELG8_9BACL|nr:hypothetical protein A3842_16255 [Paenibacillus sp. P3E]OKP82792.1 hypothetical protein A3844_23485 [Paenibacillus helianthi]OKP89436.1 hypothetical protein A3848_14900 [Paenibacillus sp. P32E]
MPAAFFEQLPAFDGQLIHCLQIGPDGLGIGDCSNLSENDSGRRGDSKVRTLFYSIDIVLKYHIHY